MEKRTYCICTVEGSDEFGDGSEEKPFKSLFKAMCIANTSDYTYFKVSTIKDSQKEWEKPSKSSLKKAQGRFEEHRKKKEKATTMAALVAEKNEKHLEGAKSVTDSDPDLPQPKLVKIRECGNTIDQQQRVKVFGFVHRIRQQSCFFEVSVNSKHL